MELLHVHGLVRTLIEGVTILRHTANDIVRVRCMRCELQLLLFTSLMLVEFMSSGVDVRLTDGRRTFGLAGSNAEKGLIRLMTCKTALL